MINNLAFISIGQAGGNMGQPFERLGFTVLYYNSSKEDLDTLKNSKLKKHLKGGEGCNKDRNKAKELFKNNYENILNEIQSTIKQKFVVILFGSGGGTGSGISPTLAYALSESTDKDVMLATPLPSLTESIKAQINAYECFQEIEQLNLTGCTFVLDNNNWNVLTLNRNFAKLFYELCLLPQHKSASGNIDMAELKEMLKTPGYSLLAKLPKRDSTIAKLMETLQQSIFAPIQNDKVIKYIGLSVCSKRDHDFTPENLIKEFGVYVDLFQNKNPDHTLLFLTGLTLPYDRLEVIKSIIDTNKEAVTKNITQKEPKLNESIDFLGGAIQTMKNNNKFTGDIFDRFTR